MELRETISALFAMFRTTSDYGNPDEFADFVLALPEIRDALDHVCRDQEILTPEQVRQVGRIYGGEPKTIRVTDD